MKSLLSHEQVREILNTFPSWQASNDKELSKTFSFPTFRDAIAFVNKCADIAEIQNHHPDIDIRYTKIKLSISSHDVGGITERDQRFIKTVEAL